MLSVCSVSMHGYSYYLALESLRRPSLTLFVLSLSEGSVFVIVSGKLFFRLTNFLSLLLSLVFGFLEHILIRARAWLLKEEVLPWRDIDPIAGVLRDRLSVIFETEPDLLDKVP